jgi:two-component system, chemotaxis family, protein-glutamate methylesterase/glutaminase
VRVLIVEDSLVVRTYLEELLQNSPGIDLLPSAPDGETGVKSAIEDAPDVVLMDLLLPGIHGIEAIGQIMATRPRPIVVLSSEVGNKDVAFAALQAGALELVAKPEGVDALTVASFGKKLARTLHLMSGIRVVRRANTSVAPLLDIPRVPAATSAISVLAIGASTGGPPLLLNMLRAIVGPPRIPVLLSQHIISGFDDGFGAWLSQESGHQVRVPKSGEPLDPEVVFLAPADANLIVTPAGTVDIVAGRYDEVTPNVNCMFESIARTLGDAGAGVLLSGMGVDGAAGLLEIRRAGGHTLAQDEASSVVYGMPQAALQNGAVDAPTAVSSITEWVGAVASRRK